MSYKAWFDAHADKHAKIVRKLEAIGSTQQEIIEYFEYENMRKHESDFCPLYMEGKKCHDMEQLNCYLCACPNFRFCDDGLGVLDGVTAYSNCSIASKDGLQQNYGGKIHQNCSNCTVPHGEQYVAKQFDKEWKNIMKECEAHNKIECIQGDKSFLEQLRGKNANFVLSAGYTKTALIDGITVAGLAGFIEYTPALDMEVLMLGRPMSMPDIAKAPDGPPSPVLIAMAVSKLSPFALTFVDTGLSVKPQCQITTLDSKPAESVLDGADVDAKGLFEAGIKYASQIANSAEYFILSECVPAGTTTAYAVTKALGYDCDGAFSSSGSDIGIKSLKYEVVTKALGREAFESSDIFGVISRFGDTMQPFVAGLAIELSKTKPVVLGGGTQMAAVCAIIKAVGEKEAFKNIALITTEWVAKDAHSDIARLLHSIEPSINAFYPSFNFADSEFKNLRLYEQGFVKEGVGAGAVTAYAYLHGVDGNAIRLGVEDIYRAFCS